MMDDETFFYGEEIKNEGFADFVIKTEERKEKNDALALAQSEIDDCKAQMKTNTELAAEDFGRAAAYFDVEKLAPVNHGQGDEPPAVAGQSTQEASMKSLKELLAENPEAKAEYDANVKAAADKARAEGETAGSEKIKVAFESALPILSSAKYPDTVKERVKSKAIAGDVEGLKDFVAIHDMNAEAVKGKAAGEEQGGETPGETPAGDLTDDGTVGNTEQLGAAVAQFKSTFGGGK
jgi:hypothetical protein